MPLSSQSDPITRERWLPVVSEIALLYGWHLRGEHLERLTDQVAHVLGNTALTKPSMAAEIVTNYYHDAATVALLQCDWGEGSAVLWEAVFEAARQTWCAEPISEGAWSDVQHRIATRLKGELHRHTYQSSLRLVIARVVTEELTTATDLNSNYEKHEQQAGGRRDVPEQATG